MKQQIEQLKKEKNAVILAHFYAPAEVQEIVDMIMYAASEKCAFLNGVHILMDGGRNVMFNRT